MTGRRPSLRLGSPVVGAPGGAGRSHVPWRESPNDLRVRALYYSTRKLHTSPCSLRLDEWWLRSVIFVSTVAGVEDFRSDKSESAEGHGRARRAWDAYARRVNSVLLPALDPAIKRWASSATGDLLGFWMTWHLYGGFEGLEEIGMASRTIWRKVAKFRRAFGVHPDDYRLPGVKLDQAEFWEAIRASKSGE